MPWWAWFLAAILVFVTAVYAGLFVWSIKRVERMNRESEKWINEPLPRWSELRPLRQRGKDPGS